MNSTKNTFYNPHFYMFSGGPGAGKTTVLEALADRGYHTVPEAARQILKEQGLIESAAHHTGDRGLYRELMLSRMMGDYMTMTQKERRGPVFFDRGIPGIRDYGGAPPPHLLNAIERCRYNPLVFMFPPWREIYVNDTERKQDFAEAEQTYRDCCRAYRASGYTLIEVPVGPLEMRVAFILDAIQ